MVMLYHRAQKTGPWAKTNVLSASVTTVLWETELCPSIYLWSVAASHHYGSAEQLQQRPYIIHKMSVTLYKQMLTSPTYLIALTI